MQEPLTDHLRGWAREILGECEAHQIESMIRRYRTKALDPSVDLFSRCELVLRADYLDERLDALFGLEEQPSSTD